MSANLDGVIVTTLRITSLFAMLALLSIAPAIGAEEYSKEQLDFFEARIRPVLIKECYGCHSNKAGNARGGLKLDTRELTHIGGSSGPAIVPGDLDESLLYNAIIHEDFVMPPKRKLAANVIEDFRNWIEMGAPDPRESSVQPINPTVSKEDIRQARESFWAFQRPILTKPIPIDQDNWSINDIDRYVLSKLRESDLEPAGEALPHQILRRLCFDLVGLPPTPEQIQYFEDLWKKAPDSAVAMVVDKLLDSPQFGERWGRHWLDVVRYAESTGREVNMTYPHAWRFRDFVIDSFNDDKPFNIFVQQQVAGDLLPAKTDETWAENLVATTFLAMGAKNVNEQNRVQFTADVVDEQIDATTRVFLGMSVSCARCHDHKFDAFSQADYYALAGVFGNATTYFGNPPSDLGSFSTPQRKRQSSLIRLPIDDPNPYDKEYSQAELADLRAEMQSLMEEAAASRRNRSSGGNNANAQRQRIALANKLSSLSAKLAVVDDNGQPISYCMGVQERTSPRDVPLLVRGEIDQRGPVVERGLPLVFGEQQLAIGADESGRLEFARWIGSNENPLTSRVMVNRIWQHLLGQGIVSSTENFGVTGQFPSHPELLDYLAVQFEKHNWSVKSVIRAIATSRTYRMSTEFSEYAHELDPDNRLLWRANPRRLDAEALRDAMLSISGELDTERPRGSLVAEHGFVRVRDGVLGDPREQAREAFAGMRERMRGSFQQSRRGPFQRRRGQQFSPQDTQKAQSEVANAIRKVSHQLDMEDAKFRSVYLPIVRDNIPRSLDVFDFADANAIVGTRESSNTPNQSLYMLNNPFVMQQAVAFANKVSSHSNNLREQIDYAFNLAYGRSATSREQQITSNFFRSFDSGSSSASRRFRQNNNLQLTLATFCQSLFASAEFRFLD